jgi:hypothetical protein
VINEEITTLYWRVDARVKSDILLNERAEYGKQILKALSVELSVEYGKGWSEQQLWHCVRFTTTFPDEEILYALRRELSWTHIRTIMYIDEAMKREFYIEMCKMERWSTRGG